jgi:hypothetical protein
MFATRSFQRSFSAATMILLLPIAMVGIGGSSAFGQAPAARSGDAVGAMASDAAGQQALQNALRRVFGTWRRDYFRSRI